MSSWTAAGHGNAHFVDALIPNYVRSFEAYVPSKLDRQLMREYGAPFYLRDAPLTPERVLLALDALAQESPG